MENNNSEKNNLNNDIEILETNDKENVEVLEIGKKSNDSINLDSDLNLKKGKSKLVKILIACIAVIVILVCGFIAFREMVLLNKKNIINGQVNSFFNMLSEKMDELENNALKVDFENDSVGLEGKLSFSSDYSDDQIDLSKLSEYSINYNGAIDIKNNKASFDANLQRSNEKLLSIASYMFENVLAIKSDELSYATYKYTFDKEIKDINLNNVFNYNDIKILVNKAGESVKSSINENNIIKENANKTINGNKMNLVKISYTYDLNEIIQNIANSYKEDSEVISILANIAGVSEDEVKEALDKVDTSSSEKIYVTVSSYNDLIFGTLKELVLEFNSEDETLSITFDKNNSNNSYSYYSNEIEGVKVNGNIDLDNNILTMNIIADDTTINLSFKKENNNKSIIEINAVSNDVIIDLVINNETISESQSKTNNTSVIVSIYADNETINLSVNSEIKLTKDVTPEEISLDYATDISLISENEIAYMEYKLESIITRILSDFVNNNYYSTYNTYDDINTYDYANSL